MLLEVEQKYPISDPAAVRQSLIALGAAFQPPIEQTDVYFSHPSRDFKQTDEALRIRRVGQENYVTYKGPKLDRETKTRREIEVPSAGGNEGFAALKELLEVLGFRRVLEVHKQRQSGEIIEGGQSVQLALDHVATLGDYLELELLADETTLPEAKACLAALAGKLQLAEQERRGYLDLLLSHSDVNR